MIDPAGSASDLWHALFERLRQEPSLQRLLGADAAACLVTAAGETRFATPALRERVAAGWAPATLKRLHALAAGLAPSAGLRLERITFGSGPDAVGRTMATRRVKGPDGALALLLVDVGARTLAPAHAPLAATADGETDGDAAPAATAALAPEPEAVAPEVLPPRLRVLYESDAQGRIVRLDASLPRLLGHPAEALQGQRWSDLIGEIVVDATPDNASRPDASTGPGGVAAAVLQDRTFSNQPTLWRLAAADATAGERAYAGQVSGLPQRDAARRFLGHRGFILLDTTATLAFPAAHAAAEAPGAPDAQAVTSQVDRSNVDRSNIVPLRQPDAPIARETGAREAGARDGDAWEGNAAGPASRVEAELAPRPAPPPLVLSLSERNAFREIARALGARFDEGGEHDNHQNDGQSDAAPHAPGQADATLPEPESQTAQAHEPAMDEVRDADASASIVAQEPQAAADAVPEALAAPDDSERAASEPATEHAAAEADGADADGAEAGAPDVGDHDGDVDPQLVNPQQVNPQQVNQVAPTGAGNVVRLVPPPRPDPFQELVDRLPMGVLVMREGRAVFANRTLLDLIGHDSVAELDEHGVDRLFVDRLFTGGAPAGGVVMLRTRDGETEAVDARLSSITFAGEPATLMAFRRAVETVDAARVEAAKLEVARAEQQARELSAILDTATDGVLTLDGHGRLLSLNRSAEALFGYDQREVIGENFTLLLAPESHLTALDYLEGLKGGGVASLLNDGREVVGRVRQGGRIPLSMTMGRVADGAERKFSAVLRDMTAWKRAETDLVEARRVAERASDQKSEVLAKISHEIRTPLNAIIGFTEVMSEERFGPIGNDRYKEYLQDIHQSGAYLISLVNDLLDLAKIEAGRMEMSFAAVSLNELIQQTVSLMQPEAGRQRVVLRTGLHPRLPPVVADERSLRQIVLNLLSNAIKFTDPGGQVIISTKLGDRGELALSVRDTGIGMTEKELQQALEPFRQVSATRRGHGTGLGLPITKALVEANKGALAISSARNEGTLVEVTFPPQRVLAS